MILRDSQTDLGVDLEPRILVHKYNIWWLEGVLKGEKDLSVIESLMEVCVFGPLDGEVPCVNIVLEGSGFEVGERLFEHVSDLLVDSGLADVAFHLGNIQKNYYKSKE